MNQKFLAIFVLIVTGIAIAVSIVIPRIPAKRIKPETLPVFLEIQALPRLGNQGNFPAGYYYPKGD